MEFCSVPLNLLAARARSICLFSCFMNSCVNSFAFGSWVPALPTFPSYCSSPSAFLSSPAIQMLRFFMPSLGLFIAITLSKQFYWLHEFSPDCLLFSTPRDITAARHLNAPQVPQHQRSQNPTHIFPLNDPFCIASITLPVVVLKPEANGHSRLFPVPYGS